MSGAISSFFESDHDRLELLLQRATERPDVVDDASYAEFRAGLLRHIAWEEKILLPSLRRRRGDEELRDLSRRLRVDHGAVALLLVPSPTPELIGEIRSILGPHNEFEEALDGLYAMADEWLAAETVELLTKLRAYPDVKVSAYYDGPRATRSAAEALAISQKQTAHRRRGSGG